jgi:hypothetical protein
MLSGYYQRECTSGGSCYGPTFWDNMASNIIGLRQMADKATDVALLPNVCYPPNIPKNVSIIDCIISDLYLKANLSSCNHAAYANDSNGLSICFLLLLQLVIVVMYLVF